MRRLVTALHALLLALPAAAQQDDGPQQEMLRSSVARQQQSDAFALQLGQQQQLLRATPDRLQELETLQMQQRQQFDNLIEQKQTSLRSAQTGSTESWGPRLETQAQRMAEDRRMLLDRARQ